MRAGRLSRTRTSGEGLSRSAKFTTLSGAGSADTLRTRATTGRIGWRWRHGKSLRGRRTHIAANRPTHAIPKERDLILRVFGRATSPQKPPLLYFETGSA